MATVSDIVKYYTDLLIMQYQDKPKAIGMVDSFVRPLVMDFLPQNVQNCFGLLTAVGDQLDILGKYIGVERRVLTFTEAITLTDDDYRTLLRIKIALNNLGSSFYEIQNFIHEQLSNIVLAFDHQNMQMSFYLNSNYISLNLAQALIRQDLLPKPMAVSFSAVLFLNDLTKIFGFRTYTFVPTNIVGFNSYVTFDSSTIFISYDDMLVLP